MYNIRSMPCQIRRLRSFIEAGIWLARSVTMMSKRNLMLIKPRKRLQKLENYFPTEPELFFPSSVENQSRINPVMSRE